MNRPCSICAENKGVMLEDLNLNLYRCKLCGHVFRVISKENEEKYEEDYFSEKHKNWFTNPSFSFFEFIYREISKQIGSAANANLRVLDAGCGNGSFLKYLKKSNSKLELYGIDLIDNRYPGITFIKQDLLKYNTNLKFDVIFNIGVAEHISSPSMLMEKFCYLLAPGGIIVTTTVNNDGLIFNVAKLLKRFGIPVAYDRFYSKHHIQFFSIRSLKRLMEKYNLLIVKVIKHNYNLRAVDYPKSNFLLKASYMVAVWVLFWLSTVLNNGML